MMPNRNSPLSRLAALAILILIMAMLGVGVGAPLAHRYRASVQEIEGALRSLQVNRRVARRQAVLSRTIERLRRNRALDGLLLPAGSDGAAVAAMQNRLRPIIGDAGAQLTSTQALPVEPGGATRRVGLRLQFAADIDALQRILHALESGRPVAVLDNLSVRGRTSRAIGTVNPLDVRVDVYAFKPAAAR